MGIDEIDKPQLLGQGIQQGRRAKLSGLHGAEYGHHLWWGNGGELGTDLLHDALLSVIGCVKMLGNGQFENAGYNG
jgi:hypothetical protein